MKRLFFDYRLLNSRKLVYSGHVNYSWSHYIGFLVKKACNSSSTSNCPTSQFWGVFKDVIEKNIEPYAMALSTNALTPKTGPRLFAVLHSLGYAAFEDMILKNVLPKAALPIVFCHFKGRVILLDANRQFVMTFRASNNRKCKKGLAQKELMTFLVPAPNQQSLCHSNGGLKLDIIDPPLLIETDQVTQVEETLKYESEIVAELPPEGAVYRVVVSEGAPDEEMLEVHVSRIKPGNFNEFEDKAKLGTLYIWTVNP